MATNVSERVHTLQEIRRIIAEHDQQHQKGKK